VPVNVKPPTHRGKVADGEIQHRNRALSFTRITLPFGVDSRCDDEILVGGI